MQEKQDKTRENKPARDEKGRLLPGNTANPFGRPAFSITALVREALQDVPEGKKETVATAFIRVLIKKAVEEGDVNMLKTIWAYMDGSPKQGVDITSQGKRLYNWELSEYARKTLQAQGLGVDETAPEQEEVDSNSSS